PLQLLFYLLFHCYRDPRALHSFPTRRSSDLLRVLVGGLDEVEELLPDQIANRLFEAERLLDVPGSVALVDPDLVELDHRRSTRSDRKSTRLNSSHVAISYAVFCLKKKKQTQH